MRTKVVEAASLAQQQNKADSDRQIKRISEITKNSLVYLVTYAPAATTNIKEQSEENRRKKTGSYKIVQKQPKPVPPEKREFC